MNTRKRVNTSPSEDLTSPSKKANQKFTSSYDAILVKSVSPQNSLRGLIGDPMVEPRLWMVNQSSAQLSWRDGKLEKTQAAMTGVVKSQDMVIDAEATTVAAKLSTRGRLELSLLCVEAYELIKEPLHEISDYLRNRPMYKVTPRWLPPFNDDEYNVMFQFPYWKFVGPKLTRFPLFEPVKRNDNGDTVKLTWPEITPGCIVRISFEMFVFRFQGRDYAGWNLEPRTCSLIHSCIGDTEFGMIDDSDATVKGESSAAEPFPLWD